MKETSFVNIKIDYHTKGRTESLVQ